MRDIVPCMLGHIKSYLGLSTSSSMDEVIQQSKMDRYAWGTDLELLTFAYLTKMCVFLLSGTTELEPIWTPQCR